MKGPGDVAGVEAEFERQKIPADRVKAIMCMTEGDGFARGYATLAFSELFHRKLGWPVNEVAKRIPLIMIGGCSGLVAPYAGLFVEDPSFEGQSNEPRLSIGVATTSDYDIEEFGTLAMVDRIVEGIRKAMSDAAIETRDVHNIQIKAPWPQGPDLVKAQKAGKKIATTDTWRAGMLARGGSALAAGIAVGEIERKKLSDADICGDWSLWSDVGSASSGDERTNFAIIVMGNSKKSKSPYRIGHAAMKDGIDVAGVYEALASAGVKASGPLPMSDSNPVDHVFLKSAVDGTPTCRGRRHVLTSDYLGAYSWLIGKAVIHATVAGIVGDPMMQVSGGFEHQGRPGGGHLAVIAKL
jgi:cyanuric acid amidohydrolase